MIPSTNGTIMKTEAQLERTVQELAAIDNAYCMMRYLGYNPKQDTWKSYILGLNSKLGDELQYLPSSNGSK